MRNQATRKMLAAGAAMLGFGPIVETAQGAAQGPFTLPPFPYAYKQNEPMRKQCSCTTTSIMRPM